MEEQTRIVVCGRSLHMAGLAASLKAEPDLDVVCVDCVEPTSRPSLTELLPAVILFDLNDPTCSLDIALLRAWPGLLLIGVDPSTDELLLLSSQSAQALSVADLLGMIPIPHRGRNTKPMREIASSPEDVDELWERTQPDGRKGTRAAPSGRASTTTNCF